MVNDIVKSLQGDLDKGIEAFKRELGKVRTGRANLSILDGVRVDYYGTPTPLNQVASLNVADARLITIKPWERSLIPEIEKSIRAAQLGLNPQSDGELVRLPMPALTQERRQELVKVVKKMAEEAKVALRGARRDANEMLKEALKDGDHHRGRRAQGPEDGPGDDGQVGRQGRRDRRDKEGSPRSWRSDRGAGLSRGARGARQEADQRGVVRPREHRRHRRSTPRGLQVIVGRARASAAPCWG